MSGEEGEMQQQNHVELTAAGVVFSDPLVVGFGRRWGGDETVMRAMQATLQAFCASVEGCALRLADAGQESALVAQIADMERRLVEAVRGGEERVVRRLGDVEGRVVGTVADGVKALLMDAITSVKEATSQAVERLGASGVADVVADRLLGGGGEGPLAVVVRGAVDAEGVLARLQGVLVEPLRAVKEELRVGMVAVREAMDGDDGETVVRLHEEIGKDVKRLDEAIRAVAGDVGKALAGQGVRDGAAAQRATDMPALIRAQVAEVVGDVHVVVAGIREKLEAMERAVAGGAKAADVEGLGRILLEKSVRAASSSKAKGQDGEDRIFDLLADRLPRREGFTLERMAGTARACDMLVKKAGRRDVRIEVKNFANAVPAKDVEKFERDLMSTGAHGIMCSLGSKIVQHSDVDMIVMPSGRFAFYLANVGEDVDTVATFIRVLHGLDEATAGGEGEQGGVRLTVEDVRRAQEVCKGYVEKVKVLKAGVAETLRLLGDINFDVLLALICGKAQPSTCPAAKGQGASRAPAESPVMQLVAPVAASGVGASGSVEMVARLHGSGSVATGGATLTVGPPVPKASARAAMSDATVAAPASGPSVTMSAAEKGALYFSSRAARTCNACGSTLRSARYMKTHKCKVQPHQADAGAT